MDSSNKTAVTRDFLAELWCLECFLGSFFVKLTSQDMNFHLNVKLIKLFWEHQQLLNAGRGQCVPSGEMLPSSCNTFHSNLRQTGGERSEPWITSSAFVLCSSARCSSSWFCWSRSWESGWFSPASLSGVGCRTTLAPPPSPDGGLWLSGLFPGRMAYFFPQSCAPEPPWLRGCREKQGKEKREDELYETQQPRMTQIAFLVLTVDTW